MKDEKKSKELFNQNVHLEKKTNRYTKTKYMTNMHAHKKQNKKRILTDQKERQGKFQKSFFI
jgi:hypothetical protein